MFIQNAETILVSLRELIIQRDAEDCGDVGRAVDSHLCGIYPPEAKPVGLEATELVAAEPVANKERALPFTFSR